LALEAPVAHFTKSVEEDRPSKRVTCLTFVKTGICASPEIDVLKPIQGKKRPLDAPNLAERHRQAVLAWIGGELLRD
jgi:hypothetical protein